MRAGIVLNIPAVFLLIIGILSLQSWLDYYTHFINQDGRFARYSCELHPRGDHLIRQDDGDDPAKATPCLCSSLSGCSSVSDVENIVRWHITESSLYIVAAAALVGIFFATRKYLKAHGIIDRRPRTIAVLGSICAFMSVISSLVPIISGAWLPGPYFYPVGDLPYTANSVYFMFVLPLASLAVAIGIFVLGKRRWLWKVIAAFLAFSIVAIIATLGYPWVGNTYFYYHRHVSLALCFVALYLLSRPETRAYYSLRHQEKPPIA